MIEGVAASLEAGRQAGKKKETVTASSVPYPHGIRLPEPRSSRQPSGASAEHEVPAEG